MWFIFKLIIFFLLYTHLEFSLEFLKTLIPLCRNQGNGHLRRKDSISTSYLPGKQFQGTQKSGFFIAINTRTVVTLPFSLAD